MQLAGSEYNQCGELANQAGIQTALEQERIDCHAMYISDQVLGTHPRLWGPQIHTTYLFKICGLTYSGYLLHSDW